MRYLVIAVFLAVSSSTLGVAADAQPSPALGLPRIPPPQYADTPELTRLITKWENCAGQQNERLSRVLKQPLNSLQPKEAEAYFQSRMLISQCIRSLESEGDLAVKTERDRYILQQAVAGLSLGFVLQERTAYQIWRGQESR